MLSGTDISLAVVVAIIIIVLYMFISNPREGCTSTAFNDEQKMKNFVISKLDKEFNRQYPGCKIFYEGLRVNTKSNMYGINQVSIFNDTAELVAFKIPESTANLGPLGELSPSKIIIRGNP
jgi:uncharacterized protein (UPF0333 family)